MVYRREFIIQVYINEQHNGYLKRIIKNSLGYYFIKTINPHRAKVWKIRKRCVTAIDKIEKLLDPTQSHLRKYTLKIVEMTDNQVLREIKLKKLSKKK